MSHTPPANALLRRSTRTVFPVTPFTMDIQPSLKRKRSDTVLVTSSAGHILPIVPLVTAEPPVKLSLDCVHYKAIDKSIGMNVSGDQTNSRVSLATTTDNGVSLTMCSNRNLETAVTRDQKAVENILQRDLEDLRGRGMNITVKQLLTKNFKNYRVRQSLTSERATEIVNRTLSENEVPVGALLSGPPFIPPDIRMGTVYQPRKRTCYPAIPPPKTLQSALESLVANAPAPERIDVVSIMEKPIKQEIRDSEDGLDEYASQMLSSFMKPDVSMPPLDPVAYPGNHLPWPIFWKHVPTFIQGDIYLFVDEVIYTPMSDIIKAGKFMVPLDVPVGFIYNERPMEVTLHDILTANGINLTKAQHFRMLQGLLQKAGVHIRVDYAERLHRLQTIKESGDLCGQEHKETVPPIRITSRKLPLICKFPDVYKSALGRRIHGAVLVDTSGEKEQLPFQTFLTTIYTEPLPLNFRRQILILHDSEIPIEQIANRFGCTVRSIHETIGTRILIERHLVDQHLIEEPNLPPAYASPPTSPFPSPTTNPTITTLPTIGEVMRPRSKIRRTHYVDLNKLVWKHFKECQNAGIQINGKHLKDQAMRYAREMGLESFRGSEGWLDAFKRRHRIDLKTMTGFPVCYESDMYDEVDKECRDDISPSLLDHHHHQSNVFLGGHHPSGGPDEFAASFFSSLASFPPPMIPEVTTSTTSTSNHLQNMINSMMTPPAAPPANGNSIASAPSTSSSSSAEPPDAGQASGNGETIFNVMRSCQIKVADKEISHALDTLRAFILAHDPAAMSLLLPLQERLALTTSAAAVGAELSST